MFLIAHKSSVRFNFHANAQFHANVSSTWLSTIDQFSTFVEAITIWPGIVEDSTVLYSTRIIHHVFRTIAINLNKPNFQILDFTWL